MIEKQTVYLSANSKDCDFIVKWYDESYENDVKKEEGYFFTPEELNEYTQKVIKQTLETAAENAECYIGDEVAETISGGDSYIPYYVNKQSIINTINQVE